MTMMDMMMTMMTMIDQGRMNETDASGAIAIARLSDGIGVSPTILERCMGFVFSLRRYLCVCRRPLAGIVFRVQGHTRRFKTLLLWGYGALFFVKAAAAAALAVCYPLQPL